jgi:hypothetical protein
MQFTFLSLFLEIKYIEEIKYIQHEGKNKTFLLLTIATHPENVNESFTLSGRRIK